MIDEDNKYVKLYRSIGCTDEEILRLKNSNLWFIDVLLGLKSFYKIGLDAPWIFTNLDSGAIMSSMLKIDKSINEVADDIYNPLGVADTIAIDRRLRTLSRNKQIKYSGAMLEYTDEHLKKYPIEGVSLDMIKYGDLNEILSIIRNKKN